MFFFRVSEISLGIFQRFLSVPYGHWSSSDNTFSVCFPPGPSFVVIIVVVVGVVVIIIAVTSCRARAIQTWRLARRPGLLVLHRPVENVILWDKPQQQHCTRRPHGEARTRTRRRQTLTRGPSVIIQRRRRRRHRRRAVTTTTWTWRPATIWRLRCTRATAARTPRAATGTTASGWWSSASIWRRCTTGRTGSTRRPWTTCSTTRRYQVGRETDRKFFRRRASEGNSHAIDCVFDFFFLPQNSILSNVWTGQAYWTTKSTCLRLAYPKTSDLQFKRWTGDQCLFSKPRAYRHLPVLRKCRKIGPDNNMFGVKTTHKFRARAWRHVRTRPRTTR